MPHSVPVSSLMIGRNEWPQLKSDTNVGTAIRILRIFTEGDRLKHGHSTPLVLDDNYNLMGFVHLIDLLKGVRHLCDKIDEPCRLNGATNKVADYVVKFAGSVHPDDGILKALDIMMEHNVSLVPVVKDNKLHGIIKLSDIFNTVASLLFDNWEPGDKDEAAFEIQVP
jgi:CBS domain-containing protein